MGLFVGCGIQRWVLGEDVQKERKEEAKRQAEGKKKREVSRAHRHTQTRVFLWGRQRRRVVMWGKAQRKEETLAAEGVLGEEG